MELIKPFYLFSFLGWVVENIKNWNDPTFIPCNTIAKYLTTNKICLYPYFPIYGFGGLFIILMYNYRTQLPLLARIIIYAIMFNVMELIAGYIGEHYICNRVTTCQNGHKMWDYKGGYNYKGYIDLEHTFYWIILGLAGEMVYEYSMDYSFFNIMIFVSIVWAFISIHNYKKLSFRTKN